MGPGAHLCREGEALTQPILGELRALNLIMNNLLSNARKFSQDLPKVTLRTRRLPPQSPWKKGRWQIQVEDQGWGFDPEDTRRIFNRFFRSKPRAPYAIPGTGLGLYLAQSASRSMGLTLRAESKGSGMGATFTLEGRE